MNTVEKETYARYLNRERELYEDGDGLPLEGDHLDDDGTIIRYKGGYIHGENGEPAIECSDCHLEYWSKGNLEKVIANYGTITEIWKNGERQDVNEEDAYEVC